MPSEHETRFLLDGQFLRLAWTAWGDPAAEPVLCVHGLTRTGRDFDALAEALSARFFVACPDLPGRGRSDWLPRAELYRPDTYVAALAHLLAALGRPVRWVGTSLGGICGMLAAASPGAPITRLVLNDVGPFIPAAAFARIRAYLGEPPAFADLAAAEAYLRRVHAPFGALTAAQWHHLARTSVRPGAGGGLLLHYDPAMAGPIVAAEPADMNLWPVWERIDVPMLVLRGVESDLLTLETAHAMGARATVHEVAGCGHAPALMDYATIELIARFLEG